MPELDDLLSRLIRNQVDFVVVGGFAAFAYGVTLVTQDLDVCADFASENLMRLQTALADLHPVHRMMPARPPLLLTPESAAKFRNLYLDTDYGQLDCVSAIEGLGDFREVKAQSVEVPLAAGNCRILSVDALIRAKEAMGRPRDHEAVIQLKAIRERLEDERRKRDA